MDALFTVYLSLRKLFGALVPGILWLAAAAWFFPDARREFTARFNDAIPDALTQYVLGIIVAYLVGNSSTWLSFRILTWIADSLDRWTGQAKGRVAAFLEWANRRFGILDRGSYVDEIVRAEDALRAQGVLTEPSAGTARYRFDHYGLYLRHFAPALAIEDREIEAEVNLLAGVVPPLAFATVVFVLRDQWWSLLLLVVLAHLVLRIHHLRHAEAFFLAYAYWAARGNEKGTGARAA